LSSPNDAQQRNVNCVEPVKYKYIQIILHVRDNIIEKYGMHLNLFIYFEKYLIKLLNNFQKGSAQ